MKTLSLSDFGGDWQAVAQGLDDVGEPITLLINGIPYGLLLPAHTARQVIARYADWGAAQTEQVRAANRSATDSGPLLTYLELLRDDPTLVPVVDGQPLEFETMMNSSFVDPQQAYQFRDPRTRKTYTFWASELRQAIGRPFASVEFIPADPKAYVEGRSQ